LRTWLADLNNAPYPLSQYYGIDQFGLKLYLSVSGTTCELSTGNVP
jgi:hypothetical protein